MRPIYRQDGQIIRNRVISVRLSEEEFFRLKVSALRIRTPMSKIVRNRIAELTGGNPISGGGGIRDGLGTESPQ